jgi:hypothetical protein
MTKHSYFENQTLTLIYANYFKIFIETIELPQIMLKNITFDLYSMPFLYGNYQLQYCHVRNMENV